MPVTLRRLFKAAVQRHDFTLATTAGLGAFASAPVLEWKVEM